ncbi:MAG: tetratricopeptide repeat protein [Chloroflexi bacterium]|nr:tetratricopeptide repeat protein [Chloroflexota bacterium]MBI4308334.1 tetratricopeptide repeat protein [Chloroflexota bacterium]
MMRPRWMHLFLALALSFVFVAAECELSKDDRQVLVDFFSSWAFDAMLSGSAGAKDVKNALDVKDAYDRVTAAQNYDRAGTLREKGDKEGALEALNEAIRLNPNAPPDYYRQRAELLEETGNHAAAVKDYDKALTAASGKFDPKDSYVTFLYQERARARNASGDYQGAVDDLNYVIRNRGEDPQLLADRAAARQNAGDTAGAKSDLNRAVAADPNNPDILKQRAEINRALGNKQDAINDYDKAMQNVRGQTLKDAKKIDDLATEKSRLQADRGDYRAAAASMDAARKAYEDRKLAPPPGVDGYRGDLLSAAAAAARDPNEKAATRDQAIAAYTRASASDPRDPTLYLGQRAALLNDKALETQNPTERNNLLGRAYQDATDAINARPGALMTDAKLARGDAQYNANYLSGRPSASGYADAIKDYQNVIDGRPADPQAEHAYRGMGDASFNRGALTGSRADFERARDGYQRAILFNPNNPAYHDALAQTHDKLGEPEKAAAARGRADQLRQQGRPPS